MRQLLKFLSVGSFALLCGCAAGLVDTQVNPMPHAVSPRPASAVEVFTSAAPTREHVDVSMIDGQGGMGEDKAVVLGEMRTHAGALGCDGLVISQEHTDESGKTNMRGTCIVYK